MQKNNTLFLCDKELADVVVSCDSRGNNNIIMSGLKYNRLVNGQSASHLFNKNTVLVRNKRVTDTLIVSDCDGNNTIKIMSETSASDSDGERNLFTEVLHRVQREQNQTTIDKYLEEKRQSLQDKLKLATQMYIAGNYMKALECYYRALTMIESDSYPDEFRLDKSDIFRIKYALVLSNMGANLFGPLKTACEMCSTLILTHGAEYPSLYLTLGRAKVLLNLYESARIMLETGLTVLDQCVVLSHLTFPASDQIIPDTNPTTLLDNLEKTLADCKNVPKPDVKCCYRLCFADSKAIYFNGPSFVGYVNVTCSKRCQYNYHRSCWKIMLKTDRVKKPSAILNERCQTDSCTGVISEIKIFDQRLKVNAAIRAKTAPASSTSDYEKYTDDSNVVESRVYKTQFQLPLSSNLKPNATAFVPGKHQTITLHLKNASKSGPAEFEDVDSMHTNADTTASDSVLQRSSLKADVPEFLPARMKPGVTKWWANVHAVTTDNGVQSIVEADSTDCFVPAPVTNQMGNLGDIFEQPVEENGGDKLKLIEDKLVWTEPIATAYVATQCQIDTNTQQTQTPKHICENKQTATAATQTETILDKRQKNCLKWIHNTCTPVVCHADILHANNQRLEDEVKDLKKQSRLEKDCFAECKRKYNIEIDELKSTVADLESQLTSVQTEFRDYKKNNTLLSVNKILLEQIQCNKNFYLPYLKTFEDKCKHMIWELEDLQAISTLAGTPSKDEVEDNLYLWRNALADVESRQRIVMQHYETLLYNITSHQYTAVFQYPGAQSLLVEPPNLMVRHFKPMLIVNRRLEQDIASQMTSFYKILAQSQPQQLTAASLQSNLELAAPQWKGTERTDANPPAQNGHGALPKVKLGEKPTTAVPMLASTSTAVPAQKGSKVRQNRAQQEPEAAQCSPSNQLRPRPVQDIIGLDALIDKLQGQFPLVDGTVITEALFSIRAQHGGLSGMSSKEILAEVKKYLRQKQQTNPVGGPPVNPWNRINTPVQWHSDQQDSGCTICFEKMSPGDTVTLRCLHLFHCICIKKWLQTNSICPICRAYTTLDDEFPPLKLK